MTKLITAIDLVRGIPEENSLPFVTEHIAEKTANGRYISDRSKFNDLIAEANELYLIQLSVDLDCKTFFPRFEDSFKLTKKSPIKKENGIEYQLQIWRKR